MFFSHFMLFPTCLEQKIWEYKTIISHLMFSSCFFLYAGNIEKCPFTYSYYALFPSSDFLSQLGGFLLLNLFAGYLGRPSCLVSDIIQ